MIHKPQIIQICIFIFITLAGFLSLAPLLNKPFIGHHDWNGVQYGNMARNYLRYGLLTTKFGQVENSGYVNPSSFAFNTHHPATLPLLLSLSAKLVGFSEASLRLVPLLFSLLGLQLIYYFAYQLTSNPFSKQNNNPSSLRPVVVGLLAVLFAVVTPMFRYYGAMPVHEPLIATLSLAFFVSYYRWRYLNRPYIYVFLSNLTAQLIGWPGFYLSALMWLVDSYLHKRIDWRSFTPLILSGIAVFSLHLTHNWWVSGSALSGGLLEILKFRLLTTTPTEAASSTLLKFFTQELRWLIIHFTLVQIGLSLIYLITNFKAVVNRRPVPVLVFALLCYGVTHALIFRNAAFIHEYMLYYLYPGLALASALTLNKLTFSRLPLLRSKINITSLILIGSLCVALSFIERHSFYLALSRSNMHEIGKKVGDEIAAFTPPQATVYVQYDQAYALVFSKFTAFYADRNLIYQDFTDLPQLLLPKPRVLIKKTLPEDYHAVGYTNKEYIYLAN